MIALFLACVLNAPVCEGAVCLVPPTITQGVEVHVAVTADLVEHHPARHALKGSRKVLRAVVSAPVRILRVVRNRERRPVRRLLGRLLRCRR